MTAIILAEFADSKRFVEAARRADLAHSRLIDALSPFPVEGIHELLEHRRSHIRIAMFIAGILMAALAYGLEYYSAVINYPYNSGGRPFDAWPAFMLVPFATGILLAAIAGFTAFMIECGLPHLSNSLFAVRDFARVSQDRFVLALARPDNEEEARRIIDFLRNAGATAIRDVEREQRP